MDNRNPRSRQSSISPPPTKKQKLEAPEAMARLPAEMIAEILQHLPANDLKSSRLVSKKFNSLICNNGRNMDRKAFDVKIKGSENGTVIEHRMIERTNSDEELLDNFDFEKWTFVEISNLELCDLRSSKQIQEVLHLLLESMVYYKQNHVRSFCLQRVNFDSSFKPILQKILTKVLPTCHELLFRNCLLPPLDCERQISNAKFEHFRWLDSPLNPMNDRIIKKFTQEMRSTLIKRNFLAEVNSVTVESASDFIEAWLNTPMPSWFNLSLNNCDETWKIKFIHELERRKLTHYCMEFQSKFNENAHIKISFLEDRQICRIWPIFDCPAKSAGRIYCSARYFRDF